AVASNFAPSMKQIAQQFEQQTGHKVIISIGSTGKHYAQIQHGAPFDVFFAADSKRPLLLEQSGVAIKGSRYTYAVGKLLLWSPQLGLVDNQGSILSQGDYQFLSIANPKLAPYGQAAKETLIQLGLWKGLKAKMVRGENIGHAFQYVKSGSAQLGFIAESQVTQPGQAIKGSFWRVPETAYQPILQQAVRLTQSSVAKEFLAFTKTADIMKLIRQFGYQTS
ncbi:MAG: molybdate ABC transporter substrate-binding protein, partial [Gammaproteobacteria bacterium]|nr:molybdate ABC transporter substrate-binding protein [Gammaproteobacteria bacterium]